MSYFSAFSKVGLDVLNHVSNIVAPLPDDEDADTIRNGLNDSNDDDNPTNHSEKIDKSELKLNLNNSTIQIGNDNKNFNNNDANIFHSPQVFFDSSARSSYDEFDSIDLTSPSPVHKYVIDDHQISYQEQYFHSNKSPCSPLYSNIEARNELKHRVHIKYREAIETELIQYQHKIKKLETDKESSKKIIQDLEHQITTWKQNYNRSSNDQIITNNSSSSTLHRDQHIEHIEHIEQLENQLQREKINYNLLQEKNKSLENRLERLQNDFNLLNTKLDTKNKEIQSLVILQSSNADAYNKLKADFSQQKLQYESLLVSYEQVQQDYQRQQQQYDEQYKNNQQLKDASSQQKSQYYDQINNHNQIIQQYNDAMQQLNDDYNDLKQSSFVKYNNLNEANQVLQLEYDNMKQKLNHYERENYELSCNYQAQLQQKAEAYQKIQSAYDVLQQETVAETAKEKDNYNLLYEKSQQYENQLEIMARQNELLTAKLNELQSFTQQNMSETDQKFHTILMKKDEDMTKLREALDMKDHEITQLKLESHQFEQLTNEIKQYHETIQEYKGKLLDQSTEVTRKEDLLQSLREELSKEIESYKIENEKLVNQMHQFQQQQRVSNGMITSLEDRLQHTDQLSNQQQQCMMKLENELVLKTNECENMKSLLKEKEQQLSLFEGRSRGDEAAMLSRETQSIVTDIYRRHRNEIHPVMIVNDQNFSWNENILSLCDYFEKVFNSLKVKKSD
jgi:chromosome segregation ATPase